MIKNLPPVTRALLIALGASFLLSIPFASLAISTLPLYPRLLLEGAQAWRLVTYPFYYFEPMSGIVGNLMKLLWTGMLILYFGAELETIVHSKRLGWALVGTTALAGLIFALLSPDGVFAGPAILVMFLLAGFAYMWPTRQVAIFGIFWIKSWIIAAVVLVLYIIPFQGFNLDTSATNIFGPIFGALAAIVFFHVMYQQYSFGKGVLSRFDRSKAPRKRAFDESNAHDVEKRIDEILDKISKGGVRSLSKDEKDFLLKHSENN